MLVVKHLSFFFFFFFVRNGGITVHFQKGLLESRRRRTWIRELCLPFNLCYIPTLVRICLSLCILNLIDFEIANCLYSALYMHIVNPSVWQNVNDVERFGFLSMNDTLP